jgi:sarcosine oxidase / L-pipecolate oxidase
MTEHADSDGVWFSNGVAVPDKPQYDVVVVGGGPMGLSAAYHCAKAGQRVVVLERFNFFNQSGSSGDLVRMFRTMYTQDFMAELAKESIPLWAELERDTGQSLIWRSGLLNFGDPNYCDGPEGNLTDPIKNLDRLGMRYRTLTAKEIMAEYPFKDLPAAFVGVFAPDNGCINVPQVLRSLYQVASALGVKLVSNAPVREIALHDDGVTVHLDGGGSQPVTARRCVIAAGAYTNHVLASLGLTLRMNIWEMTSAYYATAPGPSGVLFPSMWFQFLDPAGEPAQSNLFYGFPAVPWAPPNLARIAVDDASTVISDPEQRQLAPSTSDLENTSNFVRRHCVGTDDRPSFLGTCLQTNVKDNMFVLDLLPASIGAGHHNVAVFTAGWGFKFVPLIGRVLSDLVLKGATPFDIKRFGISRDGVLSSSTGPLAPAATGSFTRVPL